MPLPASEPEDGARYPAPVLPPPPTVEGPVDPGVVYPIGLPYTLGEIQYAADYLTLVGHLRPGVLGGLLLGGVLAVLSVPGLVSGGSLLILSLVMLLVALFVIGRSIVTIILPSPLQIIIDGILLLGYAAVFSGFMLRVMWQMLVMMRHLPAHVAAPTIEPQLYVLLGFVLIKVGILTVGGIVHLRSHRRFAHLYRGHPAQALLRLLEGWVKALQGAKLKTDTDVVTFIDKGRYGLTSALYRLRRMGDYVLVIRQQGIAAFGVHFVHRTAVTLTVHGRTLLTPYHKVTVEIGRHRPLLGVIAPDQLDRYTRWQADASTLPAPPPGVG